jgi:hypothetical protein
LAEDPVVVLNNGYGFNPMNSVVGMLLGLIVGISGGYIALHFNFEGSQIIGAGVFFLVSVSFARRLRGCYEGGLARFIRIVVKVDGKCR